ncbi:MAG: hypothetical protein ACOYMF_16550, partial [Bacteroidales bacterium]
QYLQSRNCRFRWGGSLFNSFLLFANLIPGNVIPLIKGITKMIYSLTFLKWSDNQLFTKQGGAMGIIIRPLRKTEKGANRQNPGEIFG